MPLCRSPQECSVWELKIMNICSLVAIREDSVCRCDTALTAVCFFQPRASAHPLSYVVIWFLIPQKRKGTAPRPGLLCSEGRFRKALSSIRNSEVSFDFFLSRSFCPSGGSLGQYQRTCASHCALGPHQAHRRQSHILCPTVSGT